MHDICDIRKSFLPRIKMRLRLYSLMCFVQDTLEYAIGLVQARIEQEHLLQSANDPIQLSQGKFGLQCRSSAVLQSQKQLISCKKCYDNCYSEIKSVLR